MKDYYEPWTYEYDKLLQAPANSRAIPTARAKSAITGEHIDKPEWGPNWTMTWAAPWRPWIRTRSCTR